LWILANGTEAKFYLDGTLIDTITIASTLMWANKLITSLHGKCSEFKAIDLTAWVVGDITYANVIAATPTSHFVFEKYPVGLNPTTPVYPDKMELRTLTLGVYNANTFVNVDKLSDAVRNGFNVATENGDTVIIPASGIDAGQDVAGNALVYPAGNSQGIANKWKVLNPTAELIALDTANKFVDGGGTPLEVNWNTFTDAAYTSTTRDGNNTITDLQIAGTGLPYLLPTVPTDSQVLDYSGLGLSASQVDTLLNTLFSDGFVTNCEINVSNNAIPTAASADAITGLEAAGNAITKDVA